MDAKYAPLTHYLRQRELDGDDRIELLFGTLDRLVDGLPASARRQRTWWANSSHVQAQAWRAAGWHVASVDLPGQRVVFETGVVGGAYAARRAGEPAPAPRPARRAVDVEQMPPLEDVDVHVSLRWHDAGQITLDSAGKLAFPALPAQPGLYRMTLTGAPEQERARVYIGESSSLSRRAGNYRNPTPQQQTSHRINGLLRDHLTRGGVVALSVTTAAGLDLGEVPGDLDLGRKAGRLLAENAALAVVHAAGEADVENLD